MSTQSSMDKFESALLLDDTATARRLVKRKDIDVNRCVRLAAREGLGDVCSLAIAHGAELDGMDQYGDTALCKAATRGHTELMRMLLDQGAGVDGTDVTITTPLMATAINGHADGARLLIEHGAEVNRESLTWPMTALALASMYVVKGGDQPLVADLLRKHGGLNPFNLGSPPPWHEGVEGQRQVEMIEETLGRVHPLPIERDVPAVGKLTVRRARFARVSFLFQLLFTVSLGERAGHELAICLRGDWPFHQSALEKETFRWPLDLLFALAASVAEGAKIKHGDVLAPNDPRFAGVRVPDRIRQWLVVRHESIERARKRRRGVKPVLLIVPHLAKAALKPGKDARERADTKAQVLWKKPAAGEGRNTLVIPICFDAPWVGKGITG
jgi:ankyrin repeat protein